MTTPLTPEEREEIDNLVAELETMPHTLQAYATEIVRSRSFLAAARRERLRLPAKLQRLLREKVPEQGITYADWRALHERDAPPPPRPERLV